MASGCRIWPAAPAAGRELASLAAGQVVQIQMAPVGFLAEPQELAALRQVAPVDRAQGGRTLELGGHGWCKRRAPCRWRIATRRVADLWPRSVLTKARVLPSLAHCTSSQPSAQTIVAAGGSVLVGGHLQAHHRWPGAGQIDDDAPDRRHVTADEGGTSTAGPWVRRHWFPPSSRKAGLALVLLEGGNPAAIRRPHQDRPRRCASSRKLVGVAVVLRAVEGELASCCC